MNVLTISPGAGTMSWLNQPAALTEFLGLTNNRAKVDLAALLSNVKHAKVSAIADSLDTTLVRPVDWNAAHTVPALRARLSVRVAVAGAAGAVLRAQYSTDGVNWFYLDNVSGPSVAVDATGTFASAWATLVAGAIADVHLRVVGLNGDGAIDPEFGLIQLQVQ